MSTNTVLAPADANSGTALADLSAALLNPSAPATPAPAVPAAVATPETPTTTNTALLAIGGQNYTEPQAIALITAGREATRLTQEANEAIQTVGEARFLFDILRDFTEEETLFMLDRLDEIKEARTTGKPLGAVRLHPGELAIPAGMKVPTVDINDMDEIPLYLYLTMDSFRTEVRGQLKKMLGMIQGMQNWAQGQSQLSQDEVTARQLTAQMGAEVTPDRVRELRANGFSDPVKALAFLKQGSQATTPAAKPNGQQPKPPPEAPAPGDAKTFDGSKAWTPAELQAFADKGMVPDDPKLAEHFKQSFGLK